MVHEVLAEILNRFAPEVEWDRLAPSDDFQSGAVFGWIARDDGRSDFLVIEWQGDEVGMTTSSARYSRDFDERLFGTSEGHRDCQRVEDVLGDLVGRKIVLS